MAKKTKTKSAPARKTTSDTHVTRITASDSSTPKAKKASTTTKGKAAPSAARKIRVSAPKVKNLNVTGGRFNPLRPLLRYLKGSWYELRQVRWPDRRATWGLTGALIVFVVFFVVIITLLDAGFEYLFNIMIGK